jgi:hypothetical protein
MLRVVAISSSPSLATAMTSAPRARTSWMFDRTLR